MRANDVDRARAYQVVRALLPPEPVAVIEFGCRDGRGRTYLGERVRYLGLERSRVAKPFPGVDVRVGFDWSTSADMPSGFDAGICLSVPRWTTPGNVVWRLGQAVRKDGLVVLGLKGPGEREHLKKFFREVRLFKVGSAVIAACTGTKEAREVAA